MSTSSTQRIDVKSILNTNHMGRLQKLILFFCFAIIALDGIDVVVMGLIAPQIIQEWGVSAKDLAPVLSSALVGLAIGALVSGPLSDRLGRKPILIISLAFFGIFTLLTAFSTDITHLIIYRFLTGLGAGAAAPNAATLAAEYAPDKRRSFAVNVAYCGFSLGAALGGFLAAWMIPQFGWRSMLILGGILPLILAPFLYWKMPESITYLVKHSHAQKKIQQVLKNLYPKQDFKHYTFYLNEMPSEKTGLSLILSKQYLYGTVMLWISYFMALFLIYLCSSWLPTLIKMNHFSISEAAIVTSFFQMGGPIGCLCLGWLMDHYRPRLVLFIAMCVGALATYGLGHFSYHFNMMCAFALLLGFTFNGGSVGLSAVAMSYYPTTARATGASWMNGIGRFGAILSAFAGAAMINAKMPLDTMFSLLMIPAFLSALSILIQSPKQKLVAKSPVKVS